MTVEFSILPGEYAIARLPAGAPVPEWSHHGDFVTISRTKEELSIVCASRPVPTGTRAERGWRVLALRGPFPLNAVGVLSSFAAPLAEAGVSILVVGTYDTDYVLVHGHQLDTAVAALVAAGHRQVAREN